MLYYLGSFFILLGIVFLLIPLIYLELGRPKDFIRAGLNLIIGLILIIKKNVFENSYNFFYILVTFLVTFYVVEIFFARWNQLTDQEKNKLVTYIELKKNISKILEAIYLIVGNLLSSLEILKFHKDKETSNKKKWVRNEKKDVKED